MTDKQRACLYNDLLLFLEDFVTKDYSQQLCEAIFKEVEDDITSCTTYENYNDTDLKLAVGRVLIKKIVKYVL